VDDKGRYEDVKSIQDVFRVGDTVEWVTVTRSGRSIEIKKHNGRIDEINGSKAKIKIPQRAYRKTMPLSELKVTRRVNV